MKYDLNQPAIKWQIGYGDDPALAARGITGTGMPGIVNSLIVTESGLVFGAGLDNQIRAWDSDTGRQLWSSRFGGNFLGSPVMYEMAGRQYPRGPGGERGGRPRRRSISDGRGTPPLRRWAGWPTLFPGNSQPSAGPRTWAPYNTELLGDYAVTACSLIR